MEIRDSVLTTQDAVTRVGVTMNLVLAEVRPETAELLAAQAWGQGLSVDAYLKMLLGIPEQRMP